MLIEHILHRKGHEVATIPVEATVADAVAQLRERNIGALVVTEESGEGTRVTALRSAASSPSATSCGRWRAAPDPAAPLQQSVSALMSTDLTTCEPGATVDDLMRTMTDRRIRHIPVLDGDRLTGIVSIGDVVKTRIDELQTETDTLHEYLSSGR